jgi:hypothetical protein
LTRPRLEKLAHKPNVKHLGEIPYKDLPAYIAAADVCLMPFIKTPHTQVVNPGKLYLYLAAGKPVVSTAVSPELRALQGVIFLAETAETFSAQINSALAAAKIQVEERRRFAAANDWGEKTNEMIALIKEVREHR